MAGCNLTDSENSGVLVDCARSAFVDTVPVGNPGELVNPGKPVVSKCNDLSIGEGEPDASNGPPFDDGEITAVQPERHTQKKRYRKRIRDWIIDEGSESPRQSQGICRDHISSILTALSLR